MPFPDWSLDNIRSSIPPENLRHISCFDLSLKADGSEAPEIGVSSKRGRIYKDFWKEINSDLLPELRNQIETFIDLMEDQGDACLWDLYFLGKHERHPEFADFSNKFKRLLRHVDMRTELLQVYQGSLFSVLNDSVSKDYPHGFASLLTISAC